MDRAATSRRNNPDLATNGQVALSDPIISDETTAIPVVDDTNSEPLPDAVGAEGMVLNPELANGQESESNGTATTAATNEVELGNLRNEFMSALEGNSRESCSFLAQKIAEKGLRLVREVVLSVLTVAKLKAPQRRWGVKELTATHAGLTHRFYRDGDQTYVSWDGRILTLHDELDHVHAVLRQDYGIDRANPYLKGVGQNLYQFALDKGTPVKSLTLARYDHARNVAYLHNQGTQVLKISEQGVEVVPNGTDDMLFLGDPAGGEFDTSGAWDEPEGDPFTDLVLGGAHFGGKALIHEEAVLLLRAWMVASLMTAEGMPRPMLSLIGPRGSGKSTLAKRLGQILIGPGFTVSLNQMGERDERIALSRKGFMVLDNLEKLSLRTVDNLCTAVTGGSIPLRVQRTTDRLIEVPIRPWVVTTNQLMPTDRSDLLERCIFLHLERLEAFSSSTPDVTDPAIRRQVLGQVVWEAQALVQRRERGEWVEYQGGYRMADFAALVMNLAAVLGVPDLGETALEHLVDGMESEQTTDKPEFELIELWLKKGREDVSGREFLTRDLGKELAKVQIACGVKFKQKGRPDKLGQFLTYNEVALKDQFGFSSRTGGGRKRWVKFTKMP